MEPLKIYSFVLLALLCLPCEALHLKGTWRSSNYYLFLAKFGFQQTTSTSEAELTTTQGYIYGNISSSNPDVTNSLTFVVTDSEYFLEFYGNRSVLPRTKACSMMFTKLDSIAYDATCNKGGAEDFLRKVPCPKGGYCVDEDNETKIIPGGNQFTFRVRDTSQPRWGFFLGWKYSNFHYLIIVALNISSVQVLVHQCGGMPAEWFLCLAAHLRQHHGWIWHLDGQRRPIHEAHQPLWAPVLLWTLWHLWVIPGVLHPIQFLGPHSVVCFVQAETHAAPVADHLHGDGICGHHFQFYPCVQVCFWWLWGGSPQSHRQLHWQRGSVSFHVVVAAYCERMDHYSNDFDIQG